MTGKEFDSPILQPNDKSKIIQIAVRYCLLPHPDVVRNLDGAVFPVVRNNKRRGELEKDKTLFGECVMYDDNTTPRWAFLWAHGYLRASHPPGGWTFAHVWDESKNPKAYTHVANIVMLPEYLASLSDKNGPLVDVLRYHSQLKYKWRPNKKSINKIPNDYDELEWRYLDSICNPRDQVECRLRKSKDKRAKVLCKLLGL